MGKQNAASSWLLQLEVSYSSTCYSGKLPERGLNNTPPWNIQFWSSVLRLKLRLPIVPVFFFSKTDFDLLQSKLKLPRDWVIFGCHWTGLHIHEYGVNMLLQKTCKRLEPSVRDFTNLVNPNNALMLLCSPSKPLPVWLIHTLY